MHIVKMQLVKRETDDGLMEINDDIPLGKVYTVDLDSLKKQWYNNIVYKKIHEKEVVIDVETNEWFPYELLGEIPK